MGLDRKKNDRMKNEYVKHFLQSITILYLNSVTQDRGGCEGMCTTHFNIKLLISETIGGHWLAKRESRAGLL